MALLSEGALDRDHAADMATATAMAAATATHTTLAMGAPPVSPSEPGGGPSPFLAAASQYLHCFVPIHTVYVHQHYLGHLNFLPHFIS